MSVSQGISRARSVVGCAARVFNLRGSVNLLSLEIKSSARQVVLKTRAHGAKAAAVAEGRSCHTYVAADRLPSERVPLLAHPFAEPGLPTVTRDPLVTISPISSAAKRTACARLTCR